MQHTVAKIAEAVEPQSLLHDDETLAVCSHDVFGKGQALKAVFRPQTVEELSRGIAAATSQGLAILPRGGGMSYTGGYLAPSDNCLLVDTNALDRVLEVDEDNMLVTVETGISWGKLYEHLSKRGLRVKCWGTLSGIKATVGGGMSQNGFFWGAKDGAVVDSAVNFDVVLADGTILRTGHPFFRSFGPDLTGLFCSDCGALGVKARATLKLVREGKGKAYGSFTFDDAASFLTGMAAMAREGIANECFGFDPFLQGQRMKRDSLAQDAKGLINMMRSQGSLIKGIKEGAKVAMAGRSFLDGVPFSLHCIVERRTQEIADSEIAEITRILAEHGGRPVENTVPKMLRSFPFPPVNSMVGPQGERYVPVHGYFRNSELVDVWNAIQELFVRYADGMAQQGVECGHLMSAVSPQCSLIEPVFYWPDALNPLHHDAVEPAHMAKLEGFPDNPASTELVKTLRQELIAIFQRFDAAHAQIARTYPLKSSHAPEAWSTIETLKSKLDPNNLMNPGVIGL